MLERAEFHPNIAQIKPPENNTTFSLNMPLYRQPPLEGSCTVYSLWMSAEALGVNIFDRARVEKIYKELVDTEGFPGIYIRDLLDYAKLKIPEITLKMNYIYPTEDAITALTVASILSNRALMIPDMQKNHTTAVRGINTRGIVEINDPLAGRTFTDVKKMAARATPIVYIEVSRAA
jgi:hypothetical protein